MAQVKIREEKILSDEHYVLKRIDYETQQKNGAWTTQKREVLNHGNAATVLLFNKEAQTILLTKQFRIATYVNGNGNGLLTETPAGLVDENESPHDAIIREIKEETGYAITRVEKIFDAYSSAGILTELISFFVAPYTAQQKVAKGGGLKEEGEDLEVMEVSFSDAIEMVASGEIKDAKTILLILYAQVKQLLA